MGKIEPPELVGGNCLLLRLDNPEQYLAFANHQVTIDLVERYNAFEPGGAVERLVNAYKAYNDFAGSEYLLEFEQCLKEVEALLPKESEAGNEDLV